MSFSSDIKKSVCALQVKKRCCKRALLLGLLCAHYVPESHTLSFVTDNENVSALFSWVFRQITADTPRFEITDTLHGSIAANYYKLIPPEPSLLQRTVETLDECLSDFSRYLICENCRSCFLRGLFLASGTVSDPRRKGYHLELLFKDEDTRTSVNGFLCENGFMPKQITRRGSLSLYFKNSESIEDYLTAIGAPHAALDVMNAKIYREIRNNENRRSNCDTSNISRSTSAADIQLRAIRFLVGTGKISLLPPELQLTARIRLENPECSLPEIAAMHEPPLTKSGVNHRLQKIIQFAKEDQT